MTSGDTIDGGTGLLALFARAGYARVDTPVLQPADIFIDLSGEDMRRHLFLTEDASGGELCLRPEYTIPVCRQHLAAHGPASAAYAYLGPVFRLRADEPGEFVQAGIESIGRADAPAADAEILALAVQGCALFGVTATVRFGDMALLNGLVDALGLSAANRRRIVRAVASGRAADVLSGEAPQGADEHAGLLAAIEGQDPAAARAMVEDLLTIAGMSRVGGRSAGEIAERFMERAASRGGIVPSEARDVLGRYLAIEGAPEAAFAEVRDLAAGAGLDLGAALEGFEERNARLAAAGIADACRFAADFARNLDYYTGMIFEIHDARRPGGQPVVGGGRYDNLLRHLGAPDLVPAVGCSFWLDRLAGDA